MHTGEELQEPRDQPRAEATVDEIDRMLKHYQGNRPGSEVEKMSARDAREELLSQSGLLLPQGGKSTGRVLSLYVPRLPGGGAAV